MRLRVVRLALIFTLPIIGCSGGGASAVLFVGNSYTFGNDLPGMFSDLTESGGHEVAVGMEATGGWWLRDHAASQATSDAIGSRQWDYVFLQEQSIVPSVRNERVTSMEPAIATLAKQIRHVGATPGLFLTWAHRGGFPDVGYSSYQPMQDAITNAYSGIGHNQLMTIAPVGVAWNRVLVDHPEIPLYMSDGSHPTIQGSYLAACVFYVTVFGESPVGLEFDASLGDEVAEILQQVASDVVLTDPAYWNLKPSLAHQNSGLTLLLRPRRVWPGTSRRYWRAIRRGSREAPRPQSRGFLRRGNRDFRQS